MSDKSKKYIKGDVAVVWKPELCIHSARCFRGLPDVFDPRRRPWVDTSKAEKEEIMRQVADCPSGALSIVNLAPGAREMASAEDETERIRVEVQPKGPYMIKGGCIVVDEHGNETIKEGNVALCRCGGSSNKPFCDGTHRKNNIL